MNNTNKNYRLILYDAPSICKSTQAIQLIAQYFPQDKHKTIQAMKRKRIFIIENLAQSEAETCAQELRAMQVQVDVEVMGIETEQKEWLLAEGSKWVKRGLIFASTLNNILGHYGIAEKIELTPRPQKAKDPMALIKTILYIGATLIGLGIILFFAANWDNISPSAKIIGATLLTLGFLHAGYYFKFGPTLKRNLSHAFFFLASFGIGATILLIGQIYHVQAGSYTLPLLWGILILPIPFFMKVNPVLFLSGGLWLLSHFNYQNDHNTFFWLYPILLLGILLPISLKAEKKNLFFFNIGCMMASCFMATYVSAHWGNLIYAGSFFGLYFLQRKQLFQVLALLTLAMWNLSLLSLYETFTGVLYLLPVGYFFWYAFKNKAQNFMLLNLFNTLYWLFILFHQIRKRIDLPSPEVTDIILFLLAGCLLLFSVGKRIQSNKAWQQLSQHLKIGSLITGLFLVYVLSFRFYTGQNQMVVSPVYLSAILLFLVAGLTFFILKYIQQAQKKSQQKGEMVGVFLVSLSIATALLIPANHFWHVLMFNLILFISAFMLMLKGYQDKLLALYNSGVALFVILIVTRYFDTLWRLMPRSLFFICGGIFLMLWAFFLDKKRRDIIQSLRGLD